MRLTKNAKKILAATLSMALVVSGVTVGTKQAKAADALKWTGSFTMGTSWAGEAIPVNTDEGSTIEIKGNQYNNFQADFSVNLSAFSDPTITVVATATTDGESHSFAVCAATENWTPVYAGVNDIGIAGTETTITGKLDKSVSDYVITAQGRTVSSITITDGGAGTDATTTAAPDATAIPDASATATPEPTATPEAVKGSMDKFTANFNYVADDTWAESIWEGTPVEVTGNGSYSISYTATSATQNIFMLFLETNLYKDALKEGFSLVATDVSVGSKNYKVADNGGWCFKDEKEDAQYRYNIVNPYNGPKKADGLTDLTEGQEKKINEIGTVSVAAGDVVTVYFTVKGMNSDNASATAAPAGTEPGNTTAPEATATTAPAVTAAPEATATPTPDVAQTPAPDNTDDTDDAEEAEASLTVAKKTVSIKAGKSATVKYTAVNADGDAVKAKATSANKKVAKVKVSSKKAIKITVPKNVKKGKKTVVTVKAAGKTAKVTVKVK